MDLKWPQEFPKDLVGLIKSFLPQNNYIIYQTRIKDALAAEMTAHNIERDKASKADLDVVMNQVD